MLGRSSGRGRVSPVFIGLVLTSVETPNRLSPPTNSLAPLRCFMFREGVTGSAEPAGEGSAPWLSKPVVLVELKVKVGKVETD